jgi:hypothetical protein
VKKLTSILFALMMALLILCLALPRPVAAAPMVNPAGWLFQIANSNARSWFGVTNSWSISTENDALASGTYDAIAKYGLSVGNMDDDSDTVLGELVYHVEADDIGWVDLEKHAERTETSLTWKLPPEFDIVEGDWLWTGYETKYHETREIPVSLSRHIDKTVFDSNGYQHAEFTVIFNNTNFESTYVQIIADEYNKVEEVDASFLVDTFSTNIPYSIMSKKDEHKIYVIVQPSDIDPGVEYNLSVDAKVELTGIKAPPIMYKPYFEVGLARSHNLPDAAEGKEVVMPADMLPEHMHYASVSTDVSNTWYLVLSNITSSMLLEVCSIPGDANYDAEYLFLGDSSFADEVVDFEPGEDTVSPHNNPQSAIGRPDYTDEENYVALGHGGILTVKFTDNYLIDVDGADLYVFEIGPAVEPFKVEISRDGADWIDLGIVSGQPTSLDIHDKVTPDDKFSYVRIMDTNSRMSGHPYAGADIDAVGAIGAEEKEQPPVPISDEKTFLGSVPLPNEVSTDPGVIGTNALLALLFIIVFYLASTLFNSTIKENYDVLHGWLKSVSGWLRPISRLAGRTMAPLERGKRFGSVQQLGLVVICALLYSFIDPYFNPDLEGLALFLSLAVAVAVVTYGYEGMQVLVSKRFYQMPATIKAFVFAIMVAIIFVAVSRAIDFHPGLLFGFVGVYALVSPMAKSNKQHDAVPIVIGSLVLIIVSLGAWFLTIPIHELPQGGESFWLSLAKGILIGVFVMGLEGLLFRLVPLNFNDGAKIVAWKRWIWLIIFVVVSFLFYHIIINEDGRITEAVGDMEVMMMFGLMGFFVLICGAIWLYFLLRQRRVPALETACEGKQIPPESQVLEEGVGLTSQLTKEDEEDIEGGQTKMLREPPTTGEPEKPSTTVSEEGNHGSDKED